MSEIKVILLCGTRLALPALKELAFFRMLAVVAIPRKNIEMIENVQAVLTGSGIPIIQLEKASFTNQLIAAIGEYGVTMGLVMTFSYIIPSSVYKLPVNGFFNVHPGPLPEYRGADPIFQQIKNKEKRAGVTIHKLDDNLDTGPIVIKEFIKLHSTDTYGMLTTRLAQLAARLTGVLIKLAGFDIPIPSRVQDESRAAYFQKQVATDITINWQEMDADTIIALINACNPWNKGAVTKINNEIIRLLAAEKLQPGPSPIKVPGSILAIDKNGIIISTIDNQALLVSLVYADEGFLHAERLAQLQVVPGQCFEKI